MTVPQMHAALRRVSGQGARYVPGDRRSNPHLQLHHDGTGSLMPWTYYQSSGVIEDPSGVICGSGYSGAPSAKNRPSMQNIPDVGPIPRGGYTIGEPFDSAEHGPFCLRLTPDASNEMFGRSGFLMHGDSIQHPGAASHGCIIMSRAIRERVAASDDKRLEVIA